MNPSRAPDPRIRATPAVAEDDSGRNNVERPESWIEQHGDALYRWALIRLGNEDEAADVVQETFLAALDRQKAFEGRSSERTWLIGILKHKLADHLRRRRRDRRGVSSTGPRGTESFEEPFDRRGFWVRGPSRWSDPEGQAEDSEFWETLRGCLDALPDHLAETFLLRELEGRDGPEVCRELAISPESFWKRMHRARILLRECLDLRWFGSR